MTSTGQMPQNKAGEFDRFDVLGVPVSVTTLESASAAILRWSHDETGRIVCVRDVNSTMATLESPFLLDLHHRAAMVTADGMPLVWLGKRAGHAVERTCGPDLIERVVAQSTATGSVKHFFYGGKEGIAGRLKTVFEQRFPGVVIAGISTPPFRDLTDDEIAALAREILASGANIVWIGISSPRQELLMARLVEVLPRVMIGVGAAFDFHSGAVRRAPVWMQKSGLEWLHRLLSEPQRLWRRYLIAAPKFVWLVYLDARAKKKKARQGVPD